MDVFDDDDEIAEALEMIDAGNRHINHAGRYRCACIGTMQKKNLCVGTGVA